MTNTDTCDVEGTVKQIIQLAEANCEIARVTVPHMNAAKALKPIRDLLTHNKIDIPLVADIHFLPKVAMLSLEHVEKVRINPGNFADNKKFKINEYTDAQYSEELERINETFSPFILKAKELGRSIRIGTNHGSLSDRIMNRYGDTPLGMCESALEFIRIAESHNFHEIILSMKASNPKVMIEAYRMVVSRMNEENMNYPLHLGVTEAGDGEDARIKSAVGIGSLLLDGLGDTIRVSLTEDPVKEIPVAISIAKIISDLATKSSHKPIEQENIPCELNYTPRSTNELSINSQLAIGNENPPRVLLPIPLSTNIEEAITLVQRIQVKYTDSPLEGVLLNLENIEDFQKAKALVEALKNNISFFAFNFSSKFTAEEITKLDLPDAPLILNPSIELSPTEIEAISNFTAKTSNYLSIDLSFTSFECIENLLSSPTAKEHWLFTLSTNLSDFHSVGSYRHVVELLDQHKIQQPLWIRNTHANNLAKHNDFSFTLLDNSILSGALLTEGFGNIISIETVEDTEQALILAYNILQGSRTRVYKTEFVACPSCGRTLFDLESTTAKIKAKTDHLKGVTIAIMGCIVNGPGEMADADFGYVGGAPNKINLYKGKECVRFNIPENEAVNTLIELIKENGQWIEA